MLADSPQEIVVRFHFLKILLHKGSRKKSYFLSSPTTKALTPPPPSEISGNPFFILSFKNSYFSLVVRPLPPSPLSGLTTKK